MEPTYALSICIPTYNRARHLRNCLNSLVASGVGSLLNVQVCVSDNCSTDNTRQVVDDATRSLAIKYRKNSLNLGLARNILEVVQMADGEFVWMLGDDDLMMPGACKEIVELIDQHQGVDYFYVNANHLTTDYVYSFPQPFDMVNLPKTMVPFSPKMESGELPFLKLIDPKVSFDFLGGIFLSVFRRNMWLSNVDILSPTALSDHRVYSHLDNTFPHINIFAKAFSGSKAYFYAIPASVCLTGAREWAPMYPLVKSVRLVEALDEYRKNGLPRLRYWYCRNAALNTFAPDIVRLLANKGKSGYEYVDLAHLIWSNCVYPNCYLSMFYPFFRRSAWRRLGNYFLNCLFGLIHRL